MLEKSPVIVKGIDLYSPKVEVTYDGKKVIVQKIETKKDREPVTHIYIEGIITNEEQRERNATIV